MTAARQYKIADLPPGQVGQEIIEITGGARASVLWLPPGVPDETKLDVMEALGRAFESGRQSAYDDQRATADQVPAGSSAVQRAAEAIAAAIMRGSDHVEAARAALEATSPSPAMAERAARLLLTERGVLPEVHAAWKEPLEPFCGNPDGFGPGGYSTHTLRITCLECVGASEEQLAEWERWTREGVPPEVREQSMSREEVLAYMASRGT